MVHHNYCSYGFRNAWHFPILNHVITELFPKFGECIRQWHCIQINYRCEIILQFVLLPITSLYRMGKIFWSRTQTMIEECKIDPSQFTYWCLSRNFSMTTENAAKPAQPIHAACGPPKTTQTLETLTNVIAKHR